MRLRLTILGLLTLCLLLITACSSDDTGSTSTTSRSGPRPPAGFEIYTVTGGITPPANAVNVFIAYSPESQAYMPDIIRDFNDSMAQGNNPLTGEALASGEAPVYVWGTDPVSGSSGTVAQGIVNAILNPNADNIYRPTIFQPSVGHWLSLVNFNARRDIFDLADSPATAISPVVIATWESRLNAMRATLGGTNFGWNDILDVLNSPNGWCDYGLEDCRRAVYYGHADPTVSSTGLSTTIAQYYACAAENGFTQRRLSAAAVDDSDVQNCVRNIQNLVKHYSRRTEDFIEYIGLGPDYLDFLGMEEADIICINTGGSQGGIPCVRPPAGDRLVAIYPEEGTYEHEHPFGIVNASWVTPEQQQAARLFTEYVRSEGPQRRIMQEGFRPANPNVQLEYPFVPENGVSIDTPPNLLDVPEGDAIIEIQNTWSQVKKNADVVLLVDVSGSMAAENKLESTRQGIMTLVENMNPANRVSLISFNEIVRHWDTLAPVETNINPIRYHVLCPQNRLAGYNPTPRDISFFNQCLQPDGGTSLFTATRIGVGVLEELSTSDDRIRIVILLSDGRDTCEADGCSDLRSVVSKIERSYSTRNPIIVVPIAYGDDADMLTLQQIAEASRTRVFSGDPDNITDVLDLLSGYF